MSHIPVVGVVRVEPAHPPPASQQIDRLKLCRGAQAILDNTNGVGDSFIAAMVAAAKTNGYAGYNLDWELGDGSGAAVGSSYTGKFQASLARFPSCP